MELHTTFGALRRPRPRQPQELKNFADQLQPGRLACYEQFSYNEQTRYILLSNGRLLRTSISRRKEKVTFFRDIELHIITAHNIMCCSSHVFTKIEFRISSNLSQSDCFDKKNNKKTNKI